MEKRPTRNSWSALSSGGVVREIRSLQRIVHVIAPDGSGGFMDNSSTRYASLACSFVRIASLFDPDLLEKFNAKMEPPENRIDAGIPGNILFIARAVSSTIGSINSSVIDIVPSMGDRLSEFSSTREAYSYGQL